MYEAVLPLFMAVLSSRGHHAYLFLKEGDVLFIRKILWMKYPVGRLNNLGMNTEGKEMWKDAEAELNSALLIVNLANIKAKLY